MAAEARRWCRWAAGKRRKLAARAAPVAGLARGAAIFLPLGLGTWRRIFRLEADEVNPGRLALDELDLFVEDELAGRDTLDGIREPLDVRHAVFE